MNGPADEIQRWQSRYGGPDYFYGTEPNDFLVEHAAAIPVRGAVLCLGEGEGRNAVYLAARGHHVTALDQSAAGLAKALQLAAKRGVALDVVEVCLGEYVFAPRVWQGVVSIWCHLPTALRQAVHRDVVGALAPGGVLLLESYTPVGLATWICCRRSMCFATSCQASSSSTRSNASEPYAKAAVTVVSVPSCRWLPANQPDGRRAGGAG